MLTPQAADFALPAVLRAHLLVMFVLRARFTRGCKALVALPHDD